LTLAFCAGVSPEQRALVKKISSNTADPISFCVQYLTEKGLEIEAQEFKKLLTFLEAA
jgi:hypothetical protein